MLPHKSKYVKSKTKIRDLLNLEKKKKGLIQEWYM